MQITLEDRKSSDYKRKLFTKLRTILLHIHDRCNNSKNNEYHRYGGNGVSYTSDWNTTNGFIKDADRIPGWNEKEFMRGNIQLDKDIRIKNNKLYSKNTCLWVSRADNMLNQPSRKVKFWGYNLISNQIIYREYISKTAKELSISSAGISNVLHEHKKSCSNWIFWLVGKEIPKVTRYTIRHNGIEVYGFSKKEVSRNFGKSPYYFTSNIRSKKYASGKDYWKFPLVDTELWIENVDVEFYVNKSINA